MSTAIDARQRRGLELAATKRIRRKGGLWLVPSQGHAGTYVVETGAAASCSCPDFELRQDRCKHIWAVEYVRRRETLPDGTVKTTETLRVTYAQEWPAYNAAQTHEKERVEELLRALCAGVEQPPKGKGHPRLPLSDVVFASVMKVYSTVSGRRASTDIRECATKGLIAKAPHYNSIFNYLENPALTPLLKALVAESAAPLRAVETDFAVDSSGFSTSVYARWYDAKYGKERKRNQWVKCHIMCGVKTNVVTSVEVTGPDVHDATQFPELVVSTAERFSVAEVSADKAYLSRDNVKLVDDVGAKPFIPFKVNSSAKGSEVWARLFHFYGFQRESFLAHYNKRSNVETTFSMLKRKFGGSVRSKKPTAQVNEILCKIVAHNLCVLVQSFYELGIEATFWTKTDAKGSTTDPTA